MSNPSHTIGAGPAPQAARGLLAAAELPSSDLTDEQLTEFFFCGSAAAPSAMVGLEIYGTAALLRSLVVSPNLRSTGLGSALVRRAEQQALTRGVRALYLLTTTAEPFFARLGYKRIDRREAPPSIQSTGEFADLCPTSSAFMIKQL
jgi:amino-acid N-acetyltransferase